MGPNGSGKSTLSYVLSGRDGYDVTGGRATFDGHDLLDMEPEERAAAGVFLAFQYPVELPGVGNANFLRTALNAQRRARGEAELDAVQFLKLARAEIKRLSMADDMLKRKAKFNRQTAMRNKNHADHRFLPQETRASPSCERVEEINSAPSNDHNPTP